jgi:hypothetical protein
MKLVKFGSSIKVNINGKEDFLTVKGDIILHKNGRTVARRNYYGNSFEYNNETYTIKGA